MLRTNPKKVWSEINPKPSDILTLTDSSGYMLLDVESACVLNLIFVSVFSLEGTAALPFWKFF